ncbi:cryptochrome/photolyase family protein [Plesiomonas shigelloides]|uniref:cryptochrome/photolyase family protein n=1 Tax=Plesiomonas shigelloides TaxID=703 RepID=UPI001C5AD6DD|nr:cryptochrome/photolyase family protein [Plesiomonas shigelloides]MBW3794020.1 cryptochrome/photolyase family protein [Plesiomonas shigelloides]
MRTLRFILGDQLTRTVTSLQDIDVNNDIVLMVEVHEETTYVRHHKQKLVLVLSSMRHFAESLRAEGISVDYVQLDDENNSGSFTGELQRALTRHQIDRIVVTQPGEWRVWHMMQKWHSLLAIPVEFREDCRFLCTHSAFEYWAKDGKQLRQEYFYRHMRRQTGWLMVGDKPEGGRWNYDAENRKAPPRNLSVPPSRRFTPDTITNNVMALVQQRFADHFGDVASFGWAVTRQNALEALQYFVTQLLPQFGDYQDAMKTGEDFLFHAVLSPYINIGLLTPKEVCEAALTAYQQNCAPLSAVEGFIRQILGWREYVRGIYWMKMPEYAQTNFLNATRALPKFFWTGNTELNCLREAITTTYRNAYAHHIQRLMITGNFTLLIGVAPEQVEEWYLSVYADAFEWVELPNTHGMVLHADGGFLGSKPYAASGAYINRMSDYCTGCAYDSKIKVGDKACPFNYLYWYFLSTNEVYLSSNPRMAIPYNTLAKMALEHRQQITEQAEAFLMTLENRQL